MALARIAHRSMVRALADPASAVSLATVGTSRTAEPPEGRKRRIGHIRSSGSPVVSP